MRANFETVTTQSVILVGLVVFPLASVFLHTIFNFAATWSGLMIFSVLLLLAIKLSKAGTAAANSRATQLSVYLKDKPQRFYKVKHSQFFKDKRTLYTLLACTVMNTFTSFLDPILTNRI